MAESCIETPDESFMFPNVSLNTEIFGEEWDPRVSEIERLKKANFTLRLRVFHLEGCLGLHKDNAKDYEQINTESQLLEELQREIEKKDQLLLSARDLIVSLKKELTERSVKEGAETIKYEQIPYNFSMEQTGSEDVTWKDASNNFTVEGEVRLDRVRQSCRNIAENLDSLVLGELREDLERILSYFSGKRSVQFTPHITVECLEFIDRLLASVLRGDCLLRSNMESQEVQTDPVVVLPSFVVTNWIEFLRYLVAVRLQLQGVIQGDETSPPAFPSVDCESLGEELLKLISNEIVDWEQLSDQIKLQKEDLSLTYDALGEAESLRDEAIEALEATEAERDAALKLVETLKELTISTARNDVITTETLLKEITFDDSDLGSISNDWKVNVLNLLKEQNDAYLQLEEDLRSWSKRWHSLVCDELHEFNEDGSFTCFVKEDKNKLEQRIADLLEASKEEQETWNNKYEALKAERDMETIRCQELEHESVRMIEEQVELHKKQLHQLEEELNGRREYIKGLEQELKGTCDILEYCKVKTAGFLDTMERLESCLVSLDECILENIQVDRFNEELAESSFQIVSQWKHKMTSTVKEIRELVHTCNENGTKFDWTLDLLDKGSSRLNLKLTESIQKMDCLRKELFRRNRKIEEQQERILFLEEQIRDRDFQYECREEEHRRQKLILDQEKESTLNELSSLREEYRRLHDEWLQLCEQVEDITSALEQHETFSKQLEDEKENFKLSFYRLDEEKKQIEYKYQYLYSLHFEVKESLLREVKLWKTQFSRYWEEYKNFKEVFCAFQEQVGHRWIEIVSVVQGLYNLLSTEKDESVEIVKPLEFQEANFFSEFVRHLGLLSENIQLLSEKLDSKFRTTAVDHLLERHFVCQSMVIFSTAEHSCSSGDDMKMKTNMEKERLERVCYMIESWDMEEWFQILTMKLLQLTERLAGLGNKQEKALLEVKLRNIRFHNSPMKDKRSSSNEPKIQRRFSFSPATQRFSPLQYLRLKEREQEEEILRQMKGQWLETQKYTNM